MEKNCTNCKFNIPVEGMSYSGFCTNDFQIGNLTSESTVCSKYELAEPIKGTNIAVNEVIQALMCCTDPEHSCAECSFSKYKHTCQRDLMVAAKTALEKLI